MLIERIRSLASNGIINVLEINEIIFKDASDGEDEQITEMTNQTDSQLAAVGVSAYFQSCCCETM